MIKSWFSKVNNFTFLVKLAKILFPLFNFIIFLSILWLSYKFLQTNWEFWKVLHKEADFKNLYGLFLTFGISIAYKFLYIILVSLTGYILFNLPLPKSLIDHWGRDNDVDGLFAFWIIQELKWNRKITSNSLLKLKDMSDTERLGLSYIKEHQEFKEIYKKSKEYEKNSILDKT